MNRKLPALLALASALLLFASAASAQTSYRRVSDLYLHSVADPEGFGEWVNSRQHLFDEAFFQCLDNRWERYGAAAEAALQRCAQTPAGRKYQCIQKDAEAGFGVWLRIALGVIRQEVAWERSITGEALIAGKRRIDEQAPGMWTEAILPKLQESVPRFLDCP